MPIKITAPFSAEEARKLKIGDQVLLSGTVYTARDAAHKKLVDLIAAGQQLPFDIKNATIFYVGPTPAPEGFALGAAGPTTSYRMDPFAPILIEKGLTGMIGKGKRNDAVKQAMQAHGAVYFAATGGAGALLSSTIKQVEIIAFRALGAEAIRKLTVVEMPLVVAGDCNGRDLYIEGRKQFLEGLNT